MSWYNPRSWFDSIGRIYNSSSSMFFGFGASSFKFKKIYTNKQNNDLLLKYFNQVAEVAAPVLKYYDGANQVVIKANIEEVQRLIDRPNHYQSGNEFFSLVILLKRLFGESIINSFSPLTSEGTKKPKNLFSLTPQKIGIKTSKENDFRFNKILLYLFRNCDEENTILEIEPENILHLKTSNPNFEDEQYLFGESRYSSNSDAIESIIEGYKAKVNLFSNGPRVYITGKGQGEFASVNEGEDIKIVQERMKEYGYSKDKHNTLVTDKALDVKLASFNVGQLKINENNAADFDRICDSQGINSKIFSKDTKFEDAKSALSDFYNNPFRSEIDSTVKDLEAYLKTWWPALELTVDYSQISEIVDANNKENQRLFEDVKVGLITRNEYLVQTGKEESQEPTFDQLYVLNSSNEWRPLNEKTG